MSRRRAAVKRDVLPDSRYSDKVVTKVINSIMLDGKKSIAEGIFYSAMDLIKEKTHGCKIEYFGNNKRKNWSRRI